jgi:hypothetical protein
MLRKSIAIPPTIVNCPCLLKRCFSCSATPGVEFELWTAFPRKALSDHAQTVADAQLQNAAITQSLK